MTATEIEHGTDIEIINALDFDHEEPCDFEDCENPADWVITTSCCGGKHLLCQDHFDKTLDKANKVDGFACVYCNEVVIPAITIILAADRIDRR